MKDFTTNKNEKEKYIKELKKVKKLSGEECYEITYADGRKFKNIKCHEENLAKIIKAQEEQAKKGLENKGAFVLKERKYQLATLVGAAGACIVTKVPLQMAINGTLMNVNSHILPLSIGTVCAGASLFSLIKYLSTKSKVMQLEKIDYINKNKKDLSNLKSYENSLTGLNKMKKQYFKTAKEPFSIVDIDKYSKRDLKKIMSNIRREEEYKFDYNKKKVKEKVKQ